MILVDTTCVVTIDGVPATSHWLVMVDDQSIRPIGQQIADEVRAHIGKMEAVDEDFIEVMVNTTQPLTRKVHRLG